MTLDGEALDCPLPILDPLRAVRRAGERLGPFHWRCADVPHAGRLEVTLTPLVGAPATLRYARSGSPPTWTVTTGTYISAHDLDEAILMEAPGP